jgi:transcriptional activator SPT7
MFISIYVCYQEIILHTLFEGGTTKIQDLERYIKDDVVRYGGRLGDLEKKLVGAYRDIVSAICIHGSICRLTAHFRLPWRPRLMRACLRMAMRPITLHRAFHSRRISCHCSCLCCSGGLADMLGAGEDFLGLRELGIEAEFGLKSLAVPKRLWKGKPAGEDLAAPDR